MLTLFIFLVLRNVEADVALRSTAAVFTYCRSRGLFAGISLEGSYLIERKDTNRKYVRRLNVWTLTSPNQCLSLYPSSFEHKQSAVVSISACTVAGFTPRKSVRQPFWTAKWSRHRSATTFTTSWTPTPRRTPQTGPASSCVQRWMTTYTSYRVHAWLEMILFAALLVTRSFFLIVGSVFFFRVLWGWMVSRNRTCPLQIQPYLNNCIKYRICVYKERETFEAEFWPPAFVVLVHSLPSPAAISFSLVKRR